MIVLEKASKIAKVTLNRPEKKNALTSAMYGDIASAIENAGADPSIKVIMIKGHNDFFTAGNDLGDFLANPNMDEKSHVFQFLKALICCELPIIAAVEGFAVGVGTTMLLHCDQVFAGRSASFSMPFVNLGLVPEACASLLLPKQVGYQKAANWLLTGDTFTAAEASDAGIVGQMVESGTAEEAAMKFAFTLASKPRSSLIATKRLLRRPDESMVARLHEELELFTEGLNGPAAKEAMTAFMEKRKPDFSEF